MWGQTEISSHLLRDNKLGMISAMYSLQKSKCARKFALSISLKSNFKILLSSHTNCQADTCFLSPSIREEDLIHATKNELTSHSNGGSSEASLAMSFTYGGSTERPCITTAKIFAGFNSIGCKSQNKACIAGLCIPKGRY